MIDAEYCRRKAEALLSEATRAANMKERGRLIDEAMHWHNLALEAHDQSDGRRNHDQDAEGRSAGR